MSAVLSEQFRIRAALEYIPADDRDQWCRMGMAIQSELGDAGFDLWDAWSQRSDSYNERDAKAVWKSFKGGGVTMASLFHEARAHGYRDSTPYQPIDPQEKARRDAERQVRRERDAEADVERRAAAAAIATGIWNAAKPSDGTHPYLLAKGITANDARVGDWPVIDPDSGEIRYTIKNTLILQVRDFDKRIHSVQAIIERAGDDGRGEFTKLFLRDGAMSGHFFPIGQPRKGADGRFKFIVAEGFATSASIHEATGHGCVVAFNAGNLTPVCREIRARFQDAHILIVGDRDDEEHAQSTGSRKAANAALEVGASLFIPEWLGAGRDANDVFVHGFRHKWTDMEGNLQTVDIAGPDHLQGCVEMALAAGPLTAAGLERMMEGLLPVAVPPGTATEDAAQVVERAGEREQGLRVVDDNTPVDVHSMNPLHFSDWPHLSDKMKPLNTIPNLKRLLDNYRFTVRYDVIRKDIVVRYPGRCGTADNQREAAVNTVLSLCALNRLPKAEVPGFMLSIADSNPVNPVMDFITSKPWDGRSRLDDLLASVKTRPGFDRDLYAMLMRRWFISAVAAAAKPSGFWSKGVVVFQGAQSLGKTAWFRSLLPSDLRDLLKVDATIDPGNKDTVISAVSHWLVELGELDGTLRKADIARLKGFITQDIDQFRRPYGRSEEKVQRRTVFFASVNPEQFLVDDSNVRWWTIPVMSVDPGHGVDMQQFWAEVFEWYKSGERWWLESDEESKLEDSNSSHTQTDPVEELIMGRYAGAIGGGAHKSMTASEVLLAIGYERPTQKQLQEAGKALRKLFGEPEKTKVGRYFNVPVCDQYFGGREQF
ncbi:MULTISPECIES: VapE domain-containing protein [Burkholderia]|uniref:VapE domain-containing protein n=1 Tax=Burkholderia TaxID=32008 RepID=UPI0016406E8F|nr:MULTISPECIES: VapE domain-containing protein [Burkholderia]